MSYASVEDSAYASDPFELYWFATADQNWYFTSADHKVTYLGPEGCPLV